MRKQTAKSQARRKARPLAGRELTSLGQLKPAPYNPRTISGPAMGGLTRSIEEFGDISGIVWNRRTGHLVAGHQRLAALMARYGDGVTLESGGGAPLLMVGKSAKGDTATAFPVRVVDWDEAMEKAANIAANSPHLQGDFDKDGLGRLLDELKQTDWGKMFDKLRFDDLDIRTNTLKDCPAEDVVIEESRAVMVDCDTEDEQRKVFEKLTTEGYRCRVLTL